MLGLVQCHFRFDDSMNTNRPNSERISEQLVLEKTRNFADFGLWPMLSQLDPRAWLANFRASELPYAVHLLNAFTYLSEPLTIQLFKAAVHNLSTGHHNGRTFMAARNSWRNFLNTAVFTYVTGETPNPTDSGHLFTRFVKYRLGIDQEQIVEPHDVVSRLSGGARFPLIIVDDISASGEQFLKWWNRRYQALQSPRNSMKLVAAGHSNIFFCPAICTSYAKRRILDECPSIVISAGNLLPDQYSVFHEDSNVWPDRLKSGALQFLEDASRRAGIPDTNGGEDDWRGFHKLGLCLAFSHSIPDSTIPLFTRESSTWKPLIKQG